MQEYNKIINDIIEKLENAKFAVLATSDKAGNISATQMCIINDGLDVYFQTDSKFEKVKNIKENDKVAINIGSYYFKGIATISGHPTKFPKYIEKLKVKYPQTYASYSNLKDEVLITVKLTQCKIWGNDSSKSLDEQETILAVDLINKKIDKITCDKMQ